MVKVFWAVDLIGCDWCWVSGAGSSGGAKGVHMHITVEGALC